jgi:endonuclease/exonuclease/phosphatase family metal-dependent hydrolase
MNFKRIIAACLLALFVFGAAACNTEEEGQVTETATEVPTETSKKTTKKKKETEPPVALENVEGLDLSLTILSQNLCATNRPNGNGIEERTERFVALLEENSPDVVGTQEMSVDAYNRLDDVEEYEMVGTASNGSRSLIGQYSAILYKKDRFVLMDDGTFWLSGDPDNPSKLAGAMERRTCTWAELFDTYTGRTIVVISACFDTMNETVRTEQVGILGRKLNNVLGTRMYQCQLYLACDLNATYDDGAHTALYDRAFIDTRDLTAKDLSEGKGTYHAFGNIEGGKETSFIFHRGNDDVKSYEIIEKKYTTKGQDNEGFVSDHYGVLVTFEMANE